MRGKDFKSTEVQRAVLQPQRKESDEKPPCTRHPSSHQRGQNTFHATS